MTTIFTHIYRVRAIHALLFLSSASLWAQSDDATLTNITNLEQLHAIRYDLNGDGVVSFTTAASLTGSPMFSDRAAVVTLMGADSIYAQAFTSGAFYAAADGIAAATGAVAVSTTYYYKLSSAATSSYTGYELRNNLDFEDADGDGTADDKSIWAEGASGAGVPDAVAEGWVPIGDNSTSSDASRFTATFDGSGHTISNLYINRPSTTDVGLFGSLGTGSNVRNLGIVGGSLTGANQVGGLVGNSSGTIRACYATGNATGTNDNVGGLVGVNVGTIRACYATGTATGTNNNVGGLVGSSSGTISACYATGAASGNAIVGGLVGSNNFGTISTCYATGDASGVGFVRGLVGLNAGATVTNSYFDSDVSNRPAMDDYAKTTTDLQTPTVYDDNADATDGSSIYEAWNIDVDDGLAAGVDDGTAAGDSDTDNPWDFGTSSQYPALRVDFDRSGTPSAAEFGGQGRAAPTAPAAPVVSSFTPTSGAVGATVTISGQNFSTTATDNTVTFLGEAADADNAVVMTVSAATATELTVTVPSSAMTGKIQVAVNSVVAVSSDDFTVLMSVPPTDTDADELINITTLTQLDAIRYDLNGDGVVSFTTAASLTGSPMFSDRAAVVTLMGADSIYAQAFTSGAFYAAADGIAAATGAVAVSTAYYYKLSSMATSPYTGYELRNNLDFAGTKWENPTGGTFAGTHETGGWAPLGYYTSFTDNAYYTATFDGRGYTISNLYINRPSTTNVGLFGVLGIGSNLRNLGIEGGSLTGNEQVGGLVGFSFGTISACYATGNASGSTIVGGLVGYNNSGTISACYATGTATGTGNDVGGLVGWNNSGTISACYATGNVSGGGFFGTGGLVGENLDGTISACYSTGTASGTAFAGTGGLVGFNNSGTISACYSTGDASGASSVGGLVGNNSSGGTVTNSYFDTETSSQTDAIGGGTTTGTKITNVSGKTTTELQTPTAYGTAMDIYANWNIDVDNGQPIGVDDGTMPGDAAADDPWDFGTSSQYPVLRVDFNVNGTPTAFEFGGQERAAPTAPFAPSALTAAAANTAVTLSWTAAVNDGGAPIINYMVEYDTDMNFSSSPTTVPTATAVTSHTVSGLANGTLYYFRVAAVNSVGTGAYYPGATDAAVSATPAPTAPSAPSAPSALMAAAANAAVTLNWTAPTSDGGAPIINYMVEYDTDMNFSSSPTTVPTAADATSHTVSGLTNATPYYFRVAAVNSVGTGAYYPGATDDAVGATPAMVPAAPSALMAAAANAAVTLNWTAPTSDGGAPIINYMVEYDTDMNFSSSPTTVPTATAVTSHTVSALTNATPYYFRVAAVNAAGTGAYYPGATDAAVSATPAPTAPAAPSALMAAAANAAVTLNWTAPTSDGGAAITSYMVEYDTDMNFSSSPTTVPTATAATSHTVSALTNATPYYFRVAAVNAAGTGAYYPGATDAAVSATPAPTAPAAPSALMAAAANTEATLNWTAPTSDGGAAITDYMIEYDTDMNFSSSPTTVTTATAATSHTVSALTNATPYYFRVAAVNAVGTGAYYPGAADAAVSATPAPTAPAAPSALMAAAANAAVTLNWTAPTSDGGAAITNYMVEYDTDMNFSSSPTTVSTATAATSHTVSALTNATPYYFRVAAVNAVGTGAYYPGATDAAVSATPAPVVPDASSALMATAADAAVTLNWTAAASDGGAPITGYMVEYDTDMNFPSPTPETTATAATSHTISGLTNGTLYYFRVAAVNSAGTGAYYPGATDAAVSATPTPPPPVVSSFSPIEGVVDTEVTITGDNFSATAPENDVRFGGMMAEDPTSASTTSLTVKVPSGAVTGRVSVAVGSQTGTSSTDFTVTGTTPAPDPPVVLSFSPSEGEVDTEVTITGDNFSDMSSENEVKFGGVMAEDPTSASTTSLVVLVPSGAVTGSISVAVGGQTGTSSENFTVTAPAPAPAAPVVSSFSPTEGEVDTEVTITGDNFSDMSSENEVRFGGVMSEDPTSASTTSLVVLVPSGARTGRVSVTVGGQTGTSSTDFTVTGTTPAPDPPVVLSFSPSEGEVGISVTITGENFSATALENEVKFGGVMAEDPTSASTTTLTVRVPSGAVTGSISVAVGGQTGTSSEDFTVEVPAPAPAAPVVSSFSPSEGEVGISVTITGENFSATALENEVKFGGVMAAEPTSASTTSLTVKVPSGARTGSISVAVGGQTGTSSENFTVTGTTPVSPFSVPLSSEGDVRVYPNPTSGQLHFKGLLAGGRYVCDLYSLVGQKVLSSVVRAGDTMDTSTLSSGQYILILQAEGRELMRTRLLVVR